MRVRAPEVSQKPLGALNCGLSSAAIFSQADRRQMRNVPSAVMMTAMLTCNSQSTATAAAVSEVTGEQKGHRALGGKVRPLVDWSLQITQALHTDIRPGDFKLYAAACRL